MCDKKKQVMPYSLSADTKNGIDRSRFHVIHLTPNSQANRHDIEILQTHDLSS
jgi:hypothetical protein